MYQIIIGHLTPDFKYWIDCNLLGATIRQTNGREKRSYTMNVVINDHPICERLESYLQKQIRIDIGTIVLFVFVFTTIGSYKKIR